MYILKLCILIVYNTKILLVKLYLTYVVDAASEVAVFTQSANGHRGVSVGHVT